MICHMKHRNRVSVKHGTRKAPSNHGHSWESFSKTTDEGKLVLKGRKCTVCNKTITYFNYGE